MPRKRQPRRERHVYVKGNRKQPADLPKLARALILLAQAELERAAQAEHDVQQHAEGDEIARPGDDQEVA